MSNAASLTRDLLMSDQAKPLRFATQSTCLMGL